MRRPRHALWLLLALLAVPCAAAPTGPLPLDEVMARLAQAPERHASFVEEKRLAALDAPVRSEGRLAYRKPDHLEKITTQPQPESLVVDGDRLSMGDGSGAAPRQVSLGSQPQIRALVDTIRGAVSGDLATLRRNYDVSGTGTLADWQIVLYPHDPAVAAMVKEVRLAGGAELRTIESVALNGDTDVLTVTPLPLRRLPLLLALVASGLLAFAVFSRVMVRTDMAAFLPAGHTAASRFMLNELQSGSAASLVLLGIEGAPPDQLARISAALAAGLGQDPLFTLVSNGERALDGPDGRALFDHRYLLAPNTEAAAFAVAALREDFQRLFRALQSSASPLAVQFGLPDPTGALPAVAAAWIGTASVRSVDGVWFAPDRDRALLVVQTRAGGMDISAQEAAGRAIQAAFAAANPAGARLLESGPAVFARESAASIRADVRLITIISSVLVVALLLWRFRSIAVLAAIAVPIIVSVAIAALVVQAVFGFVHGIALGFGMTMLGVTVDYPVLLIGHRKFGEPAAGTLRRIGRAFALAVACAALGLTGMVFAGFPGIAQLGLFAATGVLAAAAMTWLGLSRLVVAANLAPVWPGDTTRLLRIEQARRWRLWGLVPVALAAAFLVAVGGPAWEDDVANLSPIPRAARDLDAELRRALGAPDLGQVLVVQGDTADAVLERQEALLPAIRHLQDDGVITGFEAAARLVPSAATQRARQAALPDAATLHAAVMVAQDGIGFRPDAFAAFERAVAAARRAGLVTPESLDTPAIAARLRALLFARDGTWFGPIAFLGAIDPARLAALAGPGTLFVDMHAETNGLVSGGAARAGWWLLAGAAAALAALLAGLRQPAMVARIAGAIAASGVLTVALLTAWGVHLSVLHLVALQFTAGIGLDYALFYGRRQLDAEERARTLRTLITCNSMTLLTFGLLAFCSTPLLQAIGVTVAIGAVSAMCFSFLFVGLRPHPDAA